MELKTYDGEKEPGYPTIDEFRSNRRKYLSRMVKALGALALSGLGIFSSGKEKRGGRPKLLGEPMPVSPTTSADSTKAAPACTDGSNRTASHHGGKTPLACDTTSGAMKKMGEMKAPEPPPKKIGKVKAPEPLEPGQPPTPGVPPPPKHSADNDTAVQRTRGKPMPPKPQPPIPGKMRPPKKPMPSDSPGK